MDGIVFKYVPSLRNKGEDPVKYQCLYVTIAYVLFFVAKFLEVSEASLKVFFRQLIAHTFDPVPKRVASRVFPEEEVRSRSSNSLRCHDLVCRPVAEHPVLVYPSLMRKSIKAYDRLVGLYHDSGQVRYKLAGAVKLCRVNGCLCRILVCPGIERHDDLFHRSIARTLTQTVYGAFDLPRARPHCGKRVGDPKAEVVVAVY